MTAPSSSSSTPRRPCMRPPLPKGSRRRRVRKRGLKQGGLEEKEGQPEPRSTVLDSSLGLRVDVNAYSALLDLDENEGSTESTQCTALATSAEKQADELALIFRGWRGVIRSQAAIKRKLGLRSAAMTRAMRKAWRSMAEHSLRRGLSLVPLQAAWQCWQREVAGAAKSAEAQCRSSCAVRLPRGSGAPIALPDGAGLLPP